MTDHQRNIIKIKWAEEDMKNKKWLRDQLPGGLPLPNPLPLAVVIIVVIHLISRLWV